MYYKLWPDLLRLLKNSYLNESGLNEQDFSDDKLIQVIRQGNCLKDIRKNMLYLPINRHKDELNYYEDKEEFSYIASKKALTFNLFGNGTTEIKQNNYDITQGIYKIYYMRKLPIIKTKNSYVMGDAILHGKEELIISRVRFFEWITLKNEDIREQYLYQDIYIYDDCGEIFAELLRKLIDEYSGCFCDLDVMHIIKQIIAAYNILSKYKTSVRKITILDIYWKPLEYADLDQYAGRVYLKEKHTYEELKVLQDMLEQVSEMFEKKYNVALNIKCIDIWNMLLLQKKTKEEIKWMKRYIV